METRPMLTDGRERSKAIIEAVTALLREEIDGWPYVDAFRFSEAVGRQPPLPEVVTNRRNDRLDDLVDAVADMLLDEGLPGNEERLMNQSRAVLASMRAHRERCGLATEHPDDDEGARRRRGPGVRRTSRVLRSSETPFGDERSLGSDP